MSETSGSLVDQIKEIATKIGEEKAKADAIFSSIGDGAIATDEKGSIVRINQIALGMLGFEEAEVVGMWYPKIIDAQDSFGNKVGSIALPITKSLLSGKTVSERLFYRKKDGSALPVSITVSPVLLEGRPIGAIEVFRDITQELEIEKAKEEFISLASHQLNGPPAAIRWNLEILSDGTTGPLNDEQKNVVKMLTQITLKMIGTVNALLNISRINLGTFIVSPIPTNYVDIAKASVLELKSKIKEKNIKFEENYGSNIPLVPADPSLAKIILDNLISNAIKYTPNDGRVMVSVTLEKDEDNPAGFVAIKISDTGVGIPKEQQKKIFGKMFRANNVKDIEGTGFGLYIVKSIVELDGGKIWFESVENKGTTFYVNLSLAGMGKREGTSKINTS